MKKTPLVLILILLVGLPACGTSTPLPTPNPASTTLVDTFPEPSPVPQAASTDVPETSPSQPMFAPAGLRVVYLRDGNLWSWTETGGSSQLTGTGDMSTARLSHDGQLLAFMRGRDVWTVRMDGTDARLWVTLEKEGASLLFAPDTSFLAISTRDHIELVDLTSGNSTRVVTYPAVPDGYYPEVVWTPDASGFKTIIPPQAESGPAEMLFVFPNGTIASLAKFQMLPLSESAPFISPDGGYVIYAARMSAGKESLYLMDSSGATKPYGESMENVRAYGWLPDSTHFAYGGGNSLGGYMGSVGGLPTVIPVSLPPKLRWVDANHYLAIDNENLILGDLNGGRIPIDTSVQDYDFLP